MEAGFILPVLTLIESSQPTAAEMKMRLAVLAMTVAARRESREASSIHQTRA